MELPKIATHLVTAMQQELSDCRKCGITLGKVLGAISNGFVKGYFTIAGFDRVPRVQPWLWHLPQCGRKGRGMLLST
jgi:hypothetical protein